MLATPAGLRHGEDSTPDLSKEPHVVASSGYGCVDTNRTAGDSKRSGLHKSELSAEGSWTGQGGLMASINTVSISWDDRDRPLITVQYRDADATAAEVTPDTWLATLADRLPDKSAKYLRTLLDLNELREHVSLGELAAELGVEKKEVDGWNRNLGRSIKAVVRDHGFLRPEQEDGTAQVFDLEWDQPNNQWQYEVAARFRPVLIRALDEG